MKKIKTDRIIIGVLGRPNKDNDNDSFIGINEDIRLSIIKKNCIPFIICPLNEFNFNFDNSRHELSKDIQTELKAMVDICDALIIPGGRLWYNYDVFVVKYAIKKNIPILGICMGMQLLASLYCNNKDNLINNNTYINHQQIDKKYAHNVNIVPNTLLYDIINNHDLSVNSRHNYHVGAANNFIVSAYSEDGLIEAIELPNKTFVMGLQWHPEKMLMYDNYANKIYDYFIKKIKK